MSFGDRAFVFTFLMVMFLIFGSIIYKLVANSPLFQLSEGVMVTQPKKLSYKGIIWKTWEGWIPVGITSDGNVDRWYFTVYKGDRNVIDCINSGKKVKLYYKDYVLIPYRFGKSHQVYKCEIIE